MYSEVLIMYCRKHGLQLCINNGYSGKGSTVGSKNTRMSETMRKNQIKNGLRTFRA